MGSRTKMKYRTHKERLAVTSATQVWQRWFSVVSFRSDRVSAWHEIARNLVLRLDFYVVG